MARSAIDDTTSLTPPDTDNSFSDGFVNPLQFIVPKAPEQFVPASNVYDTSRMRTGGDQSNAIEDMDVTNPYWIAAQESVRDTPPSGREMYGGELENVAVPDIGGGRFAPRSQSQIDTMPTKNVMLRKVGDSYEAPYAQPNQAAAAAKMSGIARVAGAGQSALNILNVHADKVIPGPGGGTIYERYRKYAESGMDIDAAANKAMEDYGEALRQYAEDPNNPGPIRAAAQGARGLGLAENLAGDVTNLAAPGAGLAIGATKKAGQAGFSAVGKLSKGKTLIGTNEIPPAMIGVKEALPGLYSKYADASKRGVKSFLFKSGTGDVEVILDDTLMEGIGGATNVGKDGRRFVKVRPGMTREFFDDIMLHELEHVGQIGKGGNNLRAAALNRVGMERRAYAKTGDSPGLTADAMAKLQAGWPEDIVRDQFLTRKAAEAQEVLKKQTELQDLLDSDSPFNVLKEPGEGRFTASGKKVIDTKNNTEHEFLSEKMAQEAAERFNKNVAKDAVADIGPDQMAAVAQLRKMADDIEKGRKTLPGAAVSGRNKPMLEGSNVPPATAKGKVVEQAMMFNPASTKKGKFTPIGENLPEEVDDIARQAPITTKAVWGDIPRTEQGALEFEQGVAREMAKKEELQAAGREILESGEGAPPVRGQLFPPERSPYENLPSSDVKLSESLGPAEQRAQAGLFPELADMGQPGAMSKPTGPTFDLSDAAQRAADDANQLELKFPKQGIGSVVAKHMKGGFTESMRVSRSIAASMDLSGILRQGGIAAIAHNPEWRKGVKAVAEAFDEEKFKDLVTSMPERFDSYKLAKNAGIALDESAAMRGGEQVEYFTSKLAEKIPGVRLSERAYVAMLNETRMNIFETYSKAWGLMDTGGKTPQQLQHMERQAKDLAQFVNSITGRGNLGALESIAPQLNTMMFSPRFFASRINNVFAPLVATANALLPEGKALGLAGHKLVEGGGSWEMAALAWRDMSAWTGAMASTLALAKVAGAEVGDDPSKSDFGKIRVGNSFIDVTGGMNNLARTAYRLSTGEYTSASGKKHDLDKREFGSPTKKDVLSDYLQGVVSPNVAIGISVGLEGNRNIAGNDMGVMGHIPTPLGLNDLWEAWQEDLKGNPTLSDMIEGSPKGLPRVPTAENQGLRGAALGSMGMLGIGVQSYNPKAKPKKHSDNPIDVMLRELGRGNSEPGSGW